MTQRVAQRRSLAFGVARPAATLLTACLVMFGATRAPTAARGADAVAIANQRQAVPTPYLLIEGWLDRAVVEQALLTAYNEAGFLKAQVVGGPLTIDGDTGVLFAEPTVAIIKHTNPSGLASAAHLVDA